MGTVTLVGSRSITPHIARLCNIIGSRLTNKGVIARSGGAPGSDQEFMRFYNPDLTEIYVPWSGFSCYENEITLDTLDRDRAQEILSTITDISELKESVLKLHTRNVFQVLGRDLKSPSDRVIYFSNLRGNQPIGGTTIALMVAKKYSIRCVDILDYKGIIEPNTLELEI